MPYTVTNPPIQSLVQDLKRVTAVWQRWFLSIQQIGTYISSVAAVGSAVSLSNATAKTVTSISLPPGDWDISGVLDLHSASSTTTTLIQGGSNTTTNALGGQDSFFTNFGGTISSTDVAFTIPTQQYSVAVGTSTTVYLVAQVSFSGSALSAYGTLRARRIR